MHLAIRADGGSTIGYGHLVRSSALATEFLSRGHEVTFATQTPEAVEEVCPAEIDVHEFGRPDPETLVSWLDRRKPEVVVLDVPCVDTEYQAVVYDAVPTAVTIQDDDQHTVCADMVVNGNVFAPALNYDWIGSEPRWCLGSNYLLMRRVFRECQCEIYRLEETPKRGLLTMGGSDVRATTPTALRAFGDIGLDVDVIIGPGFTSDNRTEIRRISHNLECHVELHINPNDRRLVDLMSQAGVAVSATGTTVYELLARGTPTIGIPQSDNQVPVANALAEHGALRALRLGDSTDRIGEELAKVVNDTSLRQSLQRAGLDLVDGRGTERVCEVILATGGYSRR